jgi:heterodisulfide reductase subunit A
VLRPGDGKEPDSIAYVQCAGSRDKTLGVEYCSRVCCMYAIKQAMLLSGALPLADITIYYMDIRTFGKGYEQFYQNAQAMGIEFVKGKIAHISEDEAHNPIVRVELIDEGRIVERQHDLVVLSVGMLPAFNPQATYGVPVALDDGFVAQPFPNMSPCITHRPGIFATGTAVGPMDIVDSIVMAGAAAAETAAYLQDRQAAAQSSPRRELVYA